VRQGRVAPEQSAIVTNHMGIKGGLDLIRLPKSFAQIEKEA
jgi:hypothetical protein